MHPVTHAVNAVEAAEIKEHPYLHLVVDGVFPEAYYEQMLALFPKTSEMIHPWSDAHVYEDVWQVDLVPDPVIKGAENDRWILEKHVKDRERLAFWRKFRSHFFSNPQFVNTLLRKFDNVDLLAGGHVDMSEPWAAYPVGRLAIDLMGAGLGPHTDRADKLVSIVFYLADGTESKEVAESCGTELLTPKKNKLAQVQTDAHLTHDLFRKPQVARYLPNRMIAWPVTHDSYHAYKQGAEHERRTIKMFIQDQRLISHARNRVVDTAESAHDWRAETGEAPGEAGDGHDEAGGTVDGTA